MISFANFISVISTVFITTICQSILRDCGLRPDRQCVKPLGKVVFFYVFVFFFCGNELVSMKFLCSSQTVYPSPKHSKSKHSTFSNYHPLPTKAQRHRWPKQNHAITLRTCSHRRDLAARGQEHGAIGTRKATNILPAPETERQPICSPSLHQ